MIEDLTSCILDFQANMVRVTYRKRITVVENELEPTHTALLTYIWNHSKTREEPDGEGGVLKWRKLGFDSEDLMQEFGEVGLLGLDCLVRHRYILRHCGKTVDRLHRRVLLRKIQIISPRYARALPLRDFSTMLTLVVDRPRTTE